MESFVSVAKRMYATDEFFEFLVNNITYSTFIFTIEVTR